jgi:CDP-glucose 4,6-dehydratase
MKLQIEGNMKNYWKDKTVLVTGASGLVGSCLTNQLINYQATVVAFIQDWNPQSELIKSQDINKVYVVQGELQNFSQVERAINEYAVDSVIHLGAQTIVGTANRSPLGTFESNVRGTYNILEAARLHKSMVKRILIASSDKAYGTSKTLPYTEDMPLKGLHPYDVSKSCADLISSCYANTYNMPVIISRCGNIYGGGDLNWNRLIPGTIQSLLLNKRPIVRSNGLFTRDYVYVKDVVSAYLTLLELSSEKQIFGEAFNFGPNTPHTVLEIINHIQQLTNTTDLDPIILNQANMEIKNQSLDSSKIRSKIGWQPLYTIEQGLSETIEWYENYLNKCLVTQ